MNMLLHQKFFNISLYQNKSDDVKYFTPKTFHNGGSNSSDDDDSRVGVISRYIGKIVSLIKEKIMLFDTRILAYTSGFGESARNIASSLFVKSCYFVSIGYVGYSIYDDIIKMEDKTQEKVNLMIFDQIIWHSLASLILPVCTIQIIVDINTAIVSKINVPVIKKYSNIIPVVIGLISIPFVINFTDNNVTSIMNNTIRKSSLYKLDK